MMKKNIKNQIVSGFFWRLMERLGAQGVGFIVSLFLARLLSPENYGQIAIVSVFINILSVFAVSGIGTALIRKPNADDLDYSTVFFFNIVFSFFLYIILFGLAPVIASYYQDDSLTSIIRVLGISVILSGLNNVQRAFVSKTMQFRRFFFSTIIGTVVSGIIGIVMAFRGFGVWTIVAQQLTNEVIDVAVLWFTVGWRPRLLFSLNRLKTLYSFGWKLLASSLLENVYKSLYTFVIGKVYDAKTLGLYNKGIQFPNLIINNITSPIQSVLLPAFSLEQDDLNRVKEMTRRSIVMNAFLVFPLMFGMAAVARPMVILLLTEKWIGCVPFLQISCVALAFLPMQTANMQAINAIGRSDIFLKVETLKKIIGIALLVFSIPFGVYFMVGLNAVASVISTFISAYPNKKLLNYSYFEQIKDILPSVALSTFMAISVWSIALLHMNTVLTLILQIIVGIVLYIVISQKLNKENYFYLLSTVKSILPKKI